MKLILMTLLKIVLFLKYASPNSPLLTVQPHYCLDPNSDTRTHSLSVCVSNILVLTIMIHQIA